MTETYSPASRAVVADATPVVLPSSRRRFRQALRSFARRRLSVVGTALVILEILLAVFAQVLTPYPPNTQNFRAVLQAPSPAHPLGTDDLGRDILSRLLFGARLSL